MGILRHQTQTHGLGSKRHVEELSAPSKNHMASEAALPKQVKSKIASMNLQRVAGNVYECSADRTFWEVKEGKINRMVKGVVDTGQRIVAAPADAPANFLDEILGDLQF